MKGQEAREVEGQKAVLKTEKVYPTFNFSLYSAGLSAIVSRLMSFARLIFLILA